MSKGLEALEDIKQLVSIIELAGIKDKAFVNDELDIIEKELKRLEEIDGILNTGGGIWAENGIVYRKLKALEIIEDKQVDIHNLLDSKTCEQYNGFALWLGYKGNLTKEEYGLLKEVLE